MQDIILGLLDAKLDYTTLGGLILLYIVALWAAFSFWVFTDARKRYKKTLVGVAWFFLVFILNFPALIFYIIIRPEHEELLTHHENNQGGLNIPVANFIGNNEEVEFTLSIKLNPKSIKSDTVKFTIEGHPSVEVSNAQTKTTDEIIDDYNKNKNTLTSKLKTKASEIKSKITNLAKDFKTYSDKIEKLEEVKHNENPETPKEEKSK